MAQELHSRDLGDQERGSARRLLVYIARQHAGKHLVERLNRLSEETDRSPSHHVVAALSAYLDTRVENR